jgi:hypothetical protein
MFETNVKVFKFATGEEVIACVEKEEDGMFYVTDPFGIGLQQYPNEQQPRLVFVPFMPYTSATKSCVFNGAHCIVVVDPIDQIYNDYLGGISKIVAPRRKSIIAPP